VELVVDESGTSTWPTRGHSVLSCPPGASPLTLSDEAMEKVLARGKTLARGISISLLEGYWGEERAYHHTAPITNVYALREALRPRRRGSESKPAGRATSDWPVH